MFSVKHLVAALTLGTAMLMTPVAAIAVTPHHSTTAARATVHHVSHKKKTHKKVHRKHTTKHTALKTKHVKPTALKTTGHKHVALQSPSKVKPTTVSTTTAHRHHPMM